MILAAMILSWYILAVPILSVLLKCVESFNYDLAQDRDNYGFLWLFSPVTIPYIFITIFVGCVGKAIEYIADDII